MPVRFEVRPVAVARFAAGVFEVDRFVAPVFFVVGLAADFAARFCTAGDDGVVSSRLDRDPSRDAAFGALDAAVFDDRADRAGADPEARPSLLGDFFADDFLVVLIVIPPSEVMRRRPDLRVAVTQGRVGAIRSIFNDGLVFRGRFPESWSGNNRLRTDISASS